MNRTDYARGPTASGKLRSLLLAASAAAVSLAAACTDGTEPLPPAEFGASVSGYRDTTFSGPGQYAVKDGVLTIILAAAGDTLRPFIRITGSAALLNGRSFYPLNFDGAPTVSLVRPSAAGDGRDAFFGATGALEILGARNGRMEGRLSFQSARSVVTPEGEAWAQVSVYAEFGAARQQ